MSDIFNDEGKPTPQGSNDNPQNPDNQLVTLLAEIKNDNGEQKYKNLEDALNALKHSQEYIPQLKQQQTERDRELVDLKDQLEKLSGLEEVVQKLTQKKNDEPDTKGVQFDEEKIAQLIDSRLSEAERNAQQKNNQKKVVDTLKSKFGEKTSEVFYSKGQELGLSAEDMNALAAKSPGAVLTMFGLTGVDAQRQSPKAPSPSRINSAALPEKSGESFIGRETESLKIGATNRDMMAQMERARSMVEELHENGLSVDDLTDPANYYKLMR